MLLDRRREMGEKELLPSGAVRIDYLQSDGRQYINTGINGDSNLTIDIKATFTNSSTFVCGSAGNTNTRCCSMLRYGTDSIQFGYGNYWNLYVLKGLETLNLNLKKQNNNIIITIKSGDTIVEYTKSFINFDSGKDFCLFVNNGNSALDGGNKIHYCKLYYNDSLVRDYIPVRIGQTGYMYDKVSGQLFGNAGTSSFILGPDV